MFEIIKSYNIEYDYEANNRTIWTEYITFTFYNIKKEELPCLSFGISVKNNAKYRYLFCFLNYCKFEAVLQEVVEQFNEKFDISKVLYGE